METTAQRRNPPWGILIVLGVAWFGVIRLLSPQWSVYEQYQYGWAVPFLCLYLLFLRWQDRPGDPSGAQRSDAPYQASSPLPSPPPKVEGKESDLRIEEGGRSATRPTEERAARSGVTRPTLAGGGLAPLLCLAVCGFLLLPTRIIVEANLIWRVGSWALAGQLVIITLAVLTQAGGKAWLKHFGFAVAFFLVAVPWPSQWENALVQGLMRLNTSIVVELISLMGIPALQHGNVIEVSTGMVGVDEACSGIRSLQATFMIALFFGEFYRLNWKRRIGLVAAGAGLAMVCNVVRTFVLVYVSSRSGLEAMEKWHDPTGIAILLTCFCGLWLVAERMRRPQINTDQHGLKQDLSGERERSEITGQVKSDEVSGAQRSDAPYQGEGEGGRTEGDAEGGKGEREKGRKEGAADGVQCSVFSVREAGGGWRGVPRGVVVGLAIWLGLVEVVNALWFGLRDQQRAGVQNWTVRWPEEKPGFRKVEFSARVLGQLQSQRQDSAAWREEDGSVWQAFHLEWGPATNLQQRVNVLLAKTHRPENCLPGTGAELVAARGVKEFRVNSLVLPFRAFEFVDRGRPMFVYFCPWEDGTQGGMAQLRENSASRLRAAWLGHRSRSQRVLELAVWGKTKAEEADAALGKVLEEVITRER